MVWDKLEVQQLPFCRYRDYLTDLSSRDERSRVLFYKYVLCPIIHHRAPTSLDVSHALIPAFPESYVSLGLLYGTKDYESAQPELTDDDTREEIETAKGNAKAVNILELLRRCRKVSILRKEGYLLGVSQRSHWAA